MLPDITISTECYPHITISTECYPISILVLNVIPI